jgi:hypothetical protein
VNTVSTAQEPFDIILPLDEVKRRAVCDALDKCGGNRLRAARLLGIGKTTLYRMAKTYRYQLPKMQAEGLMSVSRRIPFRFIKDSISPSAAENAGPSLGEIKPNGAAKSL